MSIMYIHMFGRLQIQCNREPASGLESHKVQELLCYLLIHRDREHSREVLASHLWEERTTTQAKRNLRQLLYQLQSAFGQYEQQIGTMPLVIEPEWISVNVDAALWLDIWEFEEIYTLTYAVPAQQLDPDHLQSLENVIKLYKADFLEGWYQDWCILERERFQRMYLAMLQKLMEYYESKASYKAAIHFGLQLLRFDRAHERTHRQLMRMYNLVGDRTAALRQYQLCSLALKEELNVTPSDSTVSLYKEICKDLPDQMHPASAHLITPGQPLASTNRLSTDRLRQVRSSLLSLKHQINVCIQIIDNNL